MRSDCTRSITISRKNRNTIKRITHTKTTEDKQPLMQLQLKQQANRLQAVMETHNESKSKHNERDHTYTNHNTTVYSALSHGDSHMEIVN